MHQLNDTEVAKRLRDHLARAFACPDAEYAAGPARIQGGFDTTRLRVALWHKLAYPLTAIVMAVLAIPFALMMGRRSSLTGIAVAIGVALAYLSLFLHNFFRGDF